jgi:hypothetical protein
MRLRANEWDASDQAFPLCIGNRCSHADTRLRETQAMSDMNHSLRPKRPTWTHMALCVRDVDATAAWYESFTHLRVLARHEDKDGRNVWLADPAEKDRPSCW